MNIQMAYINFALLIFLVFFIFSCEPEDDLVCNNLNIIQNSFTGDIDLNSRGQDPSADFVGNGDSGTYSFEWCNPKPIASLDFDITTSRGGSVRIILRDHEGKVVLDKTRPTNGNDSYSGASDNGINGTWSVEVILTNIKGDGSFSMHPGD